MEDEDFEWNVRNWKDVDLDNQIRIWGLNYASLEILYMGLEGGTLVALKEKPYGWKKDKKWHHRGGALLWHPHWTKRRAPQ